MKSIWKEYGVIALLIVVAVGGYLLVDRNKEDILSYSLDAIGARLVALVDDDVSKRRIAAAFDSFKSRVANDEVSQDQVELVAANILNLSTSGARITPEDAELILNLNEEAMLADLPVPASPPGVLADARREPAPDEAPDPDGPVAPAAPATPGAVAPVRPPNAVRIDSRALATRIEAMVGVAESVERTIRADSIVGRYMVFSPRNGLHIQIDPQSGRHDVRVDIESIRAAAEAAARSGEATETATMIRVDESLAEEQEAWAMFMERQRRDMEKFRTDANVWSAELDVAMERLERLARLQDKGLYAPFDTVRFGARMDELMKRVRVEAVQDSASRTPPTDSDNR